MSAQASLFQVYILFKLNTMCRILLVRGDAPFDPRPHLDALSTIAHDSKEFQGHGWGCALADSGGGWHLYHDIRPIWQDSTRLDATRFPATRVLIAHARSAFRDEGITVENNMPFADETRVFAFNGELRGVRIKERGRIGAEKIFNYVKRFDHGNLQQALERGAEIIHKRCRYVRAMNIIMANRCEAVVGCYYGEDPDYFQLRHQRIDDLDIVCSQSYPGHDAWPRMEHRETITFAL